jgi:hypothetical protein
MFVFVVLSWVPFRLHSLHEILACYRAKFTLDFTADVPWRLFVVGGPPRCSRSGCGVVRHLGPPGQHRIGVPLEHTGDRANAQAFGQRTHRPYQYLSRHRLAMNGRTARFQERLVASSALQLAPRPPLGWPLDRIVPKPTQS